MKFLIYSLLGLFLFTSCKTTNNSSSAMDITTSEWKLVSVNTEKGVITPENAMKQPTLKINADGKVNGQGGCNGFFGTVKIDGKKIDFSKMASTMMACQHMEIETAYLKALEEVDSYEVKSGNLILKKGKNTLVTLSLATTLDITSLEWRVVSVETEKGVLMPENAMKQPTLRVNADGTYFGQGSCNGFRGTVKIDGKKVDFADPAATLMACPSLEFETAYINALREADSYEIKNGDLILKGKNTLVTFSTFR